MKGACEKLKALNAGARTGMTKESVCMKQGWKEGCFSCLFRKGSLNRADVTCASIAPYSHIHQLPQLLHFPNPLHIPLGHHPPPGQVASPLDKSDSSSLNETSSPKHKDPPFKNPFPRFAEGSPDFLSEEKCNGMMHKAQTRGVHHVLFG